MTQTISDDTDLTAYGTALLRVSLGTMLAAHGLLKLLVFTPAGTAAFFESIGFAGFLAYPVIAAEVIGGAALILGFKTRMVSLALVPLLIGATIPHAANGWVFSNPNGGWEFPVFWAVALVVQALLGRGAFALDSMRDGQGSLQAQAA
ncbi:DoxX family protein [Alterisphingorhabdus coralli]|uniref:DoxX family protein n=1 Tax=Alterisphingorhabdus coralli TaxID=3071408 RepID=A0AA97F9C9_9SPHN|nr:DoxX family protein [Parasphingorhabdus sp. SCSIO 66989]WOE75936.1 DoxX family protein [Parasphingorhabdus sp. SCSIO 66989]